MAAAMAARADCIASVNTVLLTGIADKLGLFQVPGFTSHIHAQVAGVASRHSFAPQSVFDTLPTLLRMMAPVSPPPVVPPHAFLHAHMASMAAAAGTMPGGHAHLQAQFHHHQQQQQLASHLQAMMAGHTTGPAHTMPVSPPVGDGMTGTMPHLSSVPSGE